ncbi:MAG: hypothetical protein Q8L27_01635 [archaeon]|nr:hypothetical protein [archaeon]
MGGIKLTYIILYKKSKIKQKLKSYSLKMTSLEEHKNKIKEHLEEIDDAIEEGAEKKPITIGFHCSACAIQFLELYLHATNRIPIGKVIKHDWFKKPQKGQRIEPLIERHLNANFPNKNEIYSLIYDLEEERNILVYGKPASEQIKNVLEKFLKIKKIFLEMLKNERIEL